MNNELGIMREETSCGEPVEPFSVCPESVEG